MDGGVDKQTNPIFTISRDQMRAINFNPKTLKDSDLVQRMPRSGCYQAHYLMPRNESAPGPKTFAAWLESRERVVGAAERLNARYPVKFVWSENGSDKALVLTVNYCEYASFVANLRWFAGPRWHEIGREFLQ
jgi:hypothetical protein